MVGKFIWHTCELGSCQKYFKYLYAIHLTCKPLHHPRCPCFNRVSSDFFLIYPSWKWQCHRSVEKFHTNPNTHPYHWLVISLPFTFFFFFRCCQMLFHSIVYLLVGSNKHYVPGFFKTPYSPAAFHMVGLAIYFDGVFFFGGGFIRGWLSKHSSVSRDWGLLMTSSYYMQVFSSSKMLSMWMTKKVDKTKLKTTFDYTRDFCFGFWI